jgi:hypothetical protein
MFDELLEEEKYQFYIFPYQKELTEKNFKNSKKKISNTHSALHFYQERHRKLEVKDVKGINPGKMVIF